MRFCQFRDPVAKRFNDPIVYVEPIQRNGQFLIDRSIYFGFTMLM
jgi:hypothetical protein